MNKQKIRIHILLAKLLLLSAIVFTQLNGAKAQTTQPETKLSKYELSIDLVPLIDQGQFGRVYFKIKHFDEFNTKGAYRFGINADLVSINDPDRIEKNISFSYNYSLIAGYEKYVTWRNTVGYYGVDFKISHSSNKMNPLDINDQQNIAFIAIPFIGIKHYLNSKFSVSFESGFGGKISYVKTFREPINKTLFYGSEIMVPYNFTLNYHF